MALPVTPAPAPVAPGALIAGKYRILHLVGEGAMGAVWAARNEATSAEVAIKLLRQPDAEMRQRIQREARVGALLKHRHILDVYDAGETATGDPFLVMQLLQGETLAGLLRRRRRLDAAEACGIASDIARALAAAHAMKVVHRDLKPANIFLHQEPGEDEPLVKVLDFGVAKDLSSSDSLRTVAGTVIGSLFYMSPEQASAQADVDHRADIWSLGVVLFEMLTGQRPFQGDAPQVLMALLQGEIPRASRVLRRIDPALDELVAGCMRRDRAERYGSAADLAKALHRMAEAGGSEGAARGSMASVPDATAVLPPAAAPMAVQTPLPVQTQMPVQAPLPPAVQTPLPLPAQTPLAVPVQAMPSAQPDPEDVVRTVPLKTRPAVGPAVPHPRGGTVRMEDAGARKVADAIRKDTEALAAPAVERAESAKKGGVSLGVIAVAGVVATGIGLGAVLLLKRGDSAPASAPSPQLSAVAAPATATETAAPTETPAPTATEAAAAASATVPPAEASAPTPTASSSAAPVLTGRLPKPEEDPCKDMTAFELRFCRERQKKAAADIAYGDGKSSPSTPPPPPPKDKLNRDNPYNELKSDPWEQK